jgi:hypothetical protein
VSKTGKKKVTFYLDEDVLRAARVRAVSEIHAMRDEQCAARGS